jgi:hypothetical protein
MDIVQNLADKPVLNIDTPGKVAAQIHNERLI